MEQVQEAGQTPLHQDGGEGGDDEEDGDGDASELMLLMAVSLGEPSAGCLLLLGGCSSAHACTNMRIDIKCQSHRLFLNRVLFMLYCSLLPWPRVSALRHSLAPDTALLSAILGDCRLGLGWVLPQLLAPRLPGNRRTRRQGEIGMGRLLLRRCSSFARRRSPLLCSRNILLADRSDRCSSRDAHLS